MFTKEPKITMQSLSFLKELTLIDFKLKYNRTILGFLWSLIKPFLMLGTLYLVFSVLLGWEIEYYQLFLLLGIIVWNFFSESTILGMRSLEAKAAIIKKFPLKNKIVVISACCNAFISLLLNLFIFSIFMFIKRIHFSFHIVLLPILLAQLLIVCLGVSFFLSATFVSFKDTAHIWEVLLQIGFWITPIIYPINIIPDKYVKWYMLNPVARVINDMRGIMIYHYLPTFWHIMITFVVTGGIFFIGISIFNRVNPFIAEKL